MVSTVTRREALKQSVAIAACFAAAGLLPSGAGAQSVWNAEAFAAPNVDAVLAALGASAPVPSEAVLLTIADLADNGAAVPVALSCALAGVQRLALLVDKNPTVLIAVFDFGEAVEANVALRIKMAESARVCAVAVLADGRVLYRAKDVQVTLGGCVL